MAKKEIDPETANEIKKELAELRAQLESQKKPKKNKFRVLKRLLNYDICYSERLHRCA